MCAAACVGFPARFALADDWGAWRGPSANGVTRESVFVSKTVAPKTVWKATVGKGYSTFAVKNGLLFTMGVAEGQEFVYCLDALTGKPLWKYQYAHGKRESPADPNPTASTATPVVDAEGAKVYTLSREGFALCLDAKSGRELWRRDLVKDTSARVPPFGFAGSPLLRGDVAVYNVGSAGIALNRKTGEFVWKSGAGNTEDDVATFSTPLLYNETAAKSADKRCILLSNGLGYASVELATGSVVWQHTWKTMYNVNACDPTPLGDGTFFVNEYDRSERFRPNANGDGKTTVVYETRDLSGPYVNPVRVGNYLFGNGKGFLRCMDAKTGKTTWGERGLGNGALILAGNDVVALTEKGELLVVAANPTTYVEKARFPVLSGKCWAQPILANGKLYCRDVDGAMICLDVSKPKSASIKQVTKTRTYAKQ